MDKMKIYINGRFLTQKVTGVQRYAFQLLEELDRENITRQTESDWSANMEVMIPGDKSVSI